MKALNLALIFLPLIAATALAQEGSYTTDEMAAAAAEQNRGSEAQAKAAYVGRAVKNAYEDSKMDPWLRSDAKARQSYIRERMEEAMRRVDGRDIRGGVLESTLKAGSTRLAMKAGTSVAKGQGGLAGAALGVGVGVGVKLGGDFVIEKSLEQFKKNPSTVVIPQTEQMAMTTQMGKEVIEHKTMTAPYYAEIQKKYLKQDLSKFKPNDSKKETLIKLAGKDENLKAKIKSAKSEDDLNKVTSSASADQLNKLTQMAEESKEAITNLKNTENNVLSVVEKESRAREERERTAKLRAEMTDGFNAMAGIAQLTGNPKLASKLSTGGQLAGVLYDLKGTKLKNILASPTSYLNSAVLVMNLTASLFGGGGGDDGTSAILEGIRQLQKQIAELRETMIKEFDRLNLKMDNYFIETYESLSRIEKGHEFDRDILLDLLSRVDYMHDEMADRFNEQLVTDMDEVCASSLGDNEGLPLPLLPGQEQVQILRCRNFLNRIAVGNMKSPSEVAKKDPKETKAEAQSASQSLQYLYNLAQNLDIYPREVTENPKVSIPVWQWSTGNILKMAAYHPEYQNFIAAGSVGDTNVSLKSVIETGSNLYFANKSIAVDERNHARGELLRKILADYKSEIKVAWRKGGAAIGADELRGPRPGLSFKDEPFVLKENEKYFDINLPLCTPEYGSQGEVIFKPKTEGSWAAVRGRIVGGRPNFFGLYEEDKVNASRFPDEGLPMTNKFQKFFEGADSILYKVRETSLTREANKAQLWGCFEKWEIRNITRHLESRQTSLELAVVLRLGFTYYDKLGKKKIVPFKRLTGSRTTLNYGDNDAKGWFTFRDMEKAMPTTMWTGGRPHSDHVDLAALNKIPGEWLTAGDLIDPKAFKEFEDFYSGQITNRNEGTWGTMKAGTKNEIEKSKQIKAALIYVLDLYKDNNETLRKFRDWARDGAHLASAEEWNHVLLNTKVSEAELEVRLDNELNEAYGYVDELEKVELTFLDTGMIQGRLDQLNRLLGPKKPSTGFGSWFTGLFGGK